MLYTSVHVSLAVLELVVHTPKKLLPNDIRLLKLQIPNNLNIPALSSNRLPANWRQYPPPDSLADIGTEWANSAEDIAMKVPSVLVPDEWNMLLNPGAKGFDKISIKSVEPFQMDERF